MDFGPIQQNAILLAGTVALPSPFPAVGQVWIIFIAENAELDVDVKIVQIVSDKRIITRFVRLADIRAIRAPAKDAARCGPEQWPIMKPKEVRHEIGKSVDEFPKGGERRTPVEIKLYDEAIVYVAETAPVLHRDEVGVTAAVSAEDVGFAGPLPTCCHREVLRCC